MSSSVSAHLSSNLIPRQATILGSSVSSLVTARLLQRENFGVTLHDWRDSKFASPLVNNERSILLYSQGRQALNRVHPHLKASATPLLPPLFMNSANEPLMFQREWNANEVPMMSYSNRYLIKSLLDNSQFETLPKLDVELFDEIKSFEDMFPGNILDPSIVFETASEGVSSTFNSDVMFHASPLWNPFHRSICRGSLMGRHLFARWYGLDTIASFDISETGLKELQELFPSVNRWSGESCLFSSKTSSLNVEYQQAEMHSNDFGGEIDDYVVTPDYLMGHALRPVFYTSSGTILKLIPHVDVEHQKINVQITVYTAPLSDKPSIDWCRPVDHVRSKFDEKFIDEVHVDISKHHGKKLPSTIENVFKLIKDKKLPIDESYMRWDRAPMSHLNRVVFLGESAQALPNLLSQQDSFFIEQAADAIDILKLWPEQSVTVFNDKKKQFVETLPPLKNRFDIEEANWKVKYVYRENCVRHLMKFTQPSLSNFLHQILLSKIITEKFAGTNLQEFLHSVERNRAHDILPTYYTKSGRHS